MVKNNRRKTTGKNEKKVAKKRKNEPSEELVGHVDVPHKKSNTEDKTIDKQNNAKLNSESVIKRSKPSDDLNKYSILKDDCFMQKIQSVSLTNNQKGRIRQNLKDSLKGTSECLLPDIIHNKILAILENSETHTDADLRKMRILFNMLKTAAQTEIPSLKKIHEDGNKEVLMKTKKVKNENDSNLNKENVDLKEDNKKNEENNIQKKKGPKRYVVFVGNLPIDINKEKIIQHFSDIKSFIKDVRLPKEKEGKSAIAYVELENETTFELALSKHHSMLGNKRINVLYTTQKNGKITKTEAKGKTAKLVALQKSGKLAGSVPMNRKRSQRRLKMKKALAKLAAETA